MSHKHIPKKINVKLAIIFPLLFSAQHLFASQGAPDPISWEFLIIGMLGGLALFLYGMGKMSEGMKKIAGNKMRKTLAALTRNRVTALLVGAFVTMVIQSSSATTVMLVSFVQAGLLSFGQSLGIILGADIGTTVTAQLIAFNVTDYALLMIAMGFGLNLFSRNDGLKNIGEIIMGFGILFFGMNLMSDAMAPLRGLPGILVAMKGMENPFLGLLVGTVFTALVQSSAASIGIVIVLAHQGLITLESGIPIILGANIGTCITAGLASINTTREAKRVALAHVLFKVAGVMLFIFWIPGFSELVRNISLRFGSDIARQIANAHTIFNVSLGVVFLPFIDIFLRLILKILPDKTEDLSIRPRTIYLDENSLSSPAMAIELARREISHMAEIVGRMLRAIIIPFVSDEKWIKRESLGSDEKELLLREIPVMDERHPNLTLFEALDMREEKIDFLNDKIHDFLIRIAKQESTANLANEIYGMISISSDLESIGDIIHRNLVKLIAKKRQLNVDFSEEGKEELMIYHEKACSQINRLQEAFSERNLEKAQKIMEGERRYLDLEAQYRIKHLERVRHERLQSVETHEVHMELMDILKQIIFYTSNIAQTFLLQYGPGLYRSQLLDETL
ncbi:MAG: Na/Pi cotransporter family protein [Deltaproteobacteria bacterium]|nr:Na/Pi cotransporter family protein [Deltaproteobacteria bacterium]